MLNRETTLPIGSIVKLTEQPDYKYIITGYYVIIENTLFDYCSVHYPLGEEKDSITATFNTSDIEEVLFEGYRNEQTEALFEELEKATTRFSEEIAKGTLKQEA